MEGRRPRRPHTARTMKSLRHDRFLRWRLLSLSYISEGLIRLNEVALAPTTLNLALLRSIQDLPTLAYPSLTSSRHAHHKRVVGNVLGHYRAR